MCRHTVIAILCLATIFTVKKSFSSPRKTNQEDPTLSFDDTETLRLLRLDSIKQQILDRLRLKSVPNATRPISSLPRPLTEIHQNENYQGNNKNLADYYGYTSQIIVFAQEDKISCSEVLDLPCLDFRLSSKFTLSEVISSAQLWLYKNTARKGHDNVTVTVMLSMEKLPKYSSIPAKIIVKKSSKRRFKGWLKIEVGEILQTWISTVTNLDKTAFRVTISYENGATFSFPLQADRKPFLVINTDNNHKRRSKRFITCSKNSKDCCRESFYVSFADLGWNNWIIQPKGYQANYCKGSCEGILLPAYRHTNIIQRLEMIKAGQEFTTCCSPAKMSGISLLHYNPDGYIEKTNLPDMVVEECKCA